MENVTTVVVNSNYKYKNDRQGGRMEDIRSSRPETR